MTFQTPAPAATILLVRDRAAFEVLMVQRHHEIDFVSGALVFPGGKVAAPDHDDAWDEVVDGGAGLAPVERALRIAAVREAFEESGLLLARARKARGVSAALADGEACAALAAIRDAVAADARLFRPALAEAGLVLALDMLTPFAHWVTPEIPGKRFDTHFFIAAAPSAQVAVCDGTEAVEAIWITPHQVLEEGRSGRRHVIFPTRLNVERLAESNSVAEAVAAARARAPFTVQPRIVMQNGAEFLTIPAEAGYSVTHEPLDGNRP